MRLIYYVFIYFCIFTNDKLLFFQVKVKKWKNVFISGSDILSKNLLIRNIIFDLHIILIFSILLLAYNDKLFNYFNESYTV